MPKHPTAIAAEAELKEALERLDREFQEGTRRIDSRYLNMIREKDNVCQSKIKEIDEEFRRESEHLDRKFQEENREIANEHQNKMRKIIDNHQENSELVNEKLRGEDLIYFREKKALASRYSSETNVCKQTYFSEKKRLNSEYSSDKERLKSKYLSDKKHLNSEAVSEIERLKTEYSSAKERLKSKYLSEREHELSKIPHVESKIPRMKLSARRPKNLEVDTYFQYIVRLTNNGNGPGYDLEFSIEGELKGDTSINISSLDENETETMELSLLPTAPGKVRYSMLLTYKDILGREYNQGGEKWFDVIKPSADHAPTYVIKDSVVDAKSTYVDESLHISRTHVDNSVNIDARDAILQRSQIKVKKK